jgi:putative ABC transport system ATP-binding protein
VFQFYNLIPSLTARENVALVTDIAKILCRRRRRWRSSGLEARLDHFPSQLSGGEQQRVAIARAVAKRPTSCSATSRPARSTWKPASVVLEAIEHVNRKLDATTAIITHNAAIAEWPTASFACGAAPSPRKR